MSSEESGEDEVITVKPLPWRHPRVDDFLTSLDEKLMSERSSQAKRQMKKRVIGSVSTRPVPTSTSLPLWALR